MTPLAADTPICVVGAGILGASAALHLVRAGARNVTLIDAGDPLSGTTPAGAGFVAAFAADTNRRFHRGCVPLEIYGIEFYRSLHEAGHDLDFAANGNLVLALTEESLDRLRAGIMEHPDRLPGTRVLDPAQIQEMTSGAVDADKIAGGIFMAEGIQLTTGKAVVAILDDLAGAGVSVRHNTRVTGIRTQDGAVTGVETADGAIPAQAVVIACGAWSNEVLATVGWRLPLVPVVATRFVTRDVGLSPTMPTVQCPDLGLWIRELDGAYSWGVGTAYRRASLLQDDGVDPSAIGRPHSPSLIEMQRGSQPDVAEVFPALNGEEPELITQGMPCYSADGNLYVGPVPSCRGVWLIGGDNESGVTHGPGMGRLVAELMMGDEPLTDPAPFRLDRTTPQDFPDEEAAVRAMAEDRIATAMG